MFKLYRIYSMDTRKLYAVPADDSEIAKSILAKKLNKDMRTLRCINNTSRNYKIQQSKRVISATFR